MKKEITTDDFITEYFPFPEDPQVIKIGDYEAFDYISPEKIDDAIHRLSEVIDFNDFDAVIVNMKGGEFLFKRLAKEKNYDGKYFEVEYHRPKDAIGTIVTVGVPDELFGKKCLVVDDIADRKTTFKSILSRLSPESVCVALITKRGVENQEELDNIFIAIEIDNKWIGGCGMDLGIEKSEDDNTFREYGGIVVNIAS